MTHECELYISTDRGRHTALVYARCQCGWESAHFSKTPLAQKAKEDHLRTVLNRDSQSEFPLQR